MHIQNIAILAGGDILGTCRQ